MKHRLQRKIAILVKVGEPIPTGPDDDPRRLTDELHTHQVELEMQNQELVRTKTDLEVSRARYFELFDLAPVAYFTFHAPGQVEALNLAAAEFLQIDRRRALGSRSGAQGARLYEIASATD